MKELIEKTIKSEETLSKNKLKFVREMLVDFYREGFSIGQTSEVKFNEILKEQGITEINYSEYAIPESWQTDIFKVPEGEYMSLPILHKKLILRNYLEFARDMSLEDKEAYDEFSKQKMTQSKNYQAMYFDIMHSFYGNSEIQAADIMTDEALNKLLLEED